MSKVSFGDPRAGLFSPWSGRIYSSVAKRWVIAGLTAATLSAALLAAVASATANPYAAEPSVGENVRFDGSAGGEKRAWAYPDIFSLEGFLRSTIDAALNSTSYEQYERKMSAVLSRSLTLNNGTQAVVQHVTHFHYRDHEDVEVQVRVADGELKHSIVWTTPAELVNSSGHRYLR
jgi:hypothetical protein